MLHMTMVIAIVCNIITYYFVICLITTAPCTSFSAAKINVKTVVTKNVTKIMARLHQVIINIENNE